jgi:hypothetical protein
MNDEPNLDKLLARSAELEDVLCELFKLPFSTTCRRTLAGRVMCNVVYEHAHSVKLLMAAGSYTSASGLYRVQFEALVRTFWVMFAASDDWVTALMTDVTPKSVAKVNKLPSINEMLAALEGKAPEVAVSKLLDFKMEIWKMLCSFVHGDYHVFQKHDDEYPPETLVNVIKGANGLCLLAGNLLVMQALDMSLKDRIRGIQQRFADCLPEPKHDTP